MKIANPIYDVVFKYMMEDNEVAKLVISTIVDEEIIKLDFLPQENIVDVTKRTLTIYRLDFKATIKTPDGEKIVIIEVQKAKFPTDIIRFRKYLGEQYIKSGTSTAPIVSIYFLGYPLDRITTPVIKVQREYIDIVNQELIKEKEEFIESLTHDSFVIQVKYLKAPYRTDIEKFLSVFDQSEKSDNDHLLEIKESDYPDEYRVVLRRLQKAALEPDIRKEMDIEDEIIKVLDDLERLVEEKDKELEEKDKVLEEKDKVLEEKDKELEEKDKVLEEKNKVLEEKDKELQKQKKLIEELKKKISQG
jgi:hypothetical protein